MLRAMSTALTDTYYSYSPSWQQLILTETSDKNNTYNANTKPSFFTGFLPQDLTKLDRRRVV